MTTILVVDHDKMTCELLSAWLGGKGYTVEIAHDGMKGLELYAQLRPQLVITEIMLPAMNGFQMIRQMKESPAKQNEACKIIVLTSVRRATSRAQSLALGAADYLNKPFSPSELESRIEKQLSLHTVH